MRTPSAPDEALCDESHSGIVSEAAVTRSDSFTHHRGAAPDGFSVMSAADGKPNHTRNECAPVLTTRAEEKQISSLRNKDDDDDHDSDDDDESSEEDEEECADGGGIHDDVAHTQRIRRPPLFPLLHEEDEDEQDDESALTEAEEIDLLDASTDDSEGVEEPEGDETGQQQENAHVPDLADASFALSAALTPLDESDSTSVSTSARAIDQVPPSATLQDEPIVSFGCVSRSSSPCCTESSGRLDRVTEAELRTVAQTRHVYLRPSRVQQLLHHAHLTHRDANTHPSSSFSLLLTSSSVPLRSTNINSTPAPQCMGNSGAEESRCNSMNNSASASASVRASESVLHTSGVSFAMSVHKIGKRDNVQPRHLVLTADHLILQGRSRLPRLLRRRGSMHCIALVRVVGVMESVRESDTLAVLIPSFHDIILRFGRLHDGDEDENENENVHHVRKENHSSERENESTIARRRRREFVAHLYAAHAQASGQTVASRHSFVYRRVDDVMSVARRRVNDSFTPLLVASIKPTLHHPTLKESYPSTTTTTTNITTTTTTAHVVGRNPDTCHAATRDKDENDVDGIVYRAHVPAAVDTSDHLCARMHPILLPLLTRCGAVCVYWSSMVREARWHLPPILRGLIVTDAALYLTRDTLQACVRRVGWDEVCQAYVDTDTQSVLLQCVRQKDTLFGVQSSREFAALLLTVRRVSERVAGRPLPVVWSRQLYSHACLTAKKDNSSSSAAVMNAESSRPHRHTNHHQQQQSMVLFDRVQLPAFSSAANDGEGAAKRRRRRPCVRHSQRHKRVVRRAGDLVCFVV